MIPQPPHTPPVSAVSALDRWRTAEADVWLAWGVWMRASGSDRAHARLDFGVALSDEADAARLLEREGP